MTNNIVDTYNEKLDTLTNQFYSTLDDFRSSFISYHKDQSNEEFRRFFYQNTYIVDGLIKDSFILTNDIQKETDKVNKQVNELDKDIKEEKEINEDLVFKIQQIKGSGNSATLMNKNSKELYKEQYIHNWSMFLGIFFLIYGIYSIYR